MSTRKPSIRKGNPKRHHRARGYRLRLRKLLHPRHVSGLVRSVFGQVLQLRELLPEDVRMTLLADRGFGDTELFKLLDSWGWDYVIRVKKNTYVTDHKGCCRQLREILDWPAPLAGRPS